MNKKKLIVLATLVTLTLTAAACTRERRVNREEPSPTPMLVEAVPTETALPIQPTMAIENTPQPADTVVPVIPSPVPGVEYPALSPEISGELDEIDSLLKDLDQILGNTDTNVNIP